MSKRSLRWRLGLWSFAAMTALSVFLASYYQARIGDVIETEADARAALLARHIAASSVLGALAESEELLASSLDNALLEPDVLAAAVYAGDGRAITWRGRAAPTAPTFIEPCVPCPLHGGQRWVVPIQRRSAPGLDAGTESASAIGWLVLDLSTERRSAAARSALWRGAAIALVVILLGLGVAVLLSRRLTAPLRALGQATRSIGAGKYDVPLEGSPHREIDDLAQDFGAMAAALARLDRDNQAYRQNLEAMVEARTAELSKAYDRVTALLRAKDQFVSTVSHDFRSPLAVILSSLQTLRADEAMPLEQRTRFVERAERQCKRLQAMVGDLLDLARIEHREAAVTDVSLGTLVRDHVDGARATFEERKIEVGYEAPGRELTLRGDPGLLERALGNLLDNARKFTPEGGRVVVRLTPEDGLARIDVVDSGPGIPASDLPHVFERFYQSADAAARGDGSGLGLAIVQEVVHKHGGTVSVESEPGRGTSFIMRLPCAAPSEEA